MMFVDVIGYTASALVVVTFYMKDMVPLRIAALCSNIAFLVYGMGLGLGPVVLLHATLIPLNVWRLSTALPAMVKAERTAATERGMGVLRPQNSADDGTRASPIADPSTISQTVTSTQSARSL